MKKKSSPRSAHHRKCSISSRLCKSALMIMQRLKKAGSANSWPGLTEDHGASSDLSNVFGNYWYVSTLCVSVCVLDVAANEFRNWLPHSTICIIIYLIIYMSREEEKARLTDTCPIIYENCTAHQACTILRWSRLLWYWTCVDWAQRAEINSLFWKAVSVLKKANN